MPSSVSYQVSVSAFPPPRQCPQASAVRDNVTIVKNLKRWGPRRKKRPMSSPPPLYQIIFDVIDEITHRIHNTGKILFLKIK
jgi:hypothetical protein